MYRGGDTSRDSLYECLRDIPGAREILPSPGAAGAALQDLKMCIWTILDAGEGVGEGVVQHGSTTLKRVKWHDGWFEGLQRGYRMTSEVGRDVKVGQGPARDQIRLLLDVDPHRERVIRLFEELSLDRIANEWLVPIFKELSEVAKKHGEILWPEVANRVPLWMSLTSLELFFGAPPVKDADFAAQLEEWVYTVKPEDGKNSDRRRLVEAGFRGLEAKGMVFGEQLSMLEWLKCPSRWLANGATTSRALEGSKRTKFSTYLASSQHELLRDMFSTTPPQNKVNPKRERSKTRNTVSSDWDLYLQMKWLTQGVEGALESVFPTTLSSKLKQVSRWRMWRSRMANSVGVPIDQSTFDHVPWMDIIISMVTYICARAREKAPDTALHARITEIVINRIRAGSVNWESYSWKHVRGLLSGWAWTSVLGTLMNYIEFVGIVAVTRGSLPPVDAMAFQGDDALLFADSWSQAATWVQSYMRVLPVNPGKFFVSTSRTEFLRLVITDDRVAGYLGRAVPSLMYANAWAGGKMSVQSRAASWSRLVARGGVLSRVREHCIRDIAGFTRASRSEVVDLLRTPKSLGGLGLEVGPCTWRQVREDDLLGKEQEGRIVAATDPERVPRAVRRVAERNMASHGGVFSDRDVAAGAVEGVLMGVQGGSWGAEKPVDIKIRRVSNVANISLARAFDGKDVDFKPPAYTVDPMFLPSVLRRKLKAGLDSVLGLFDPGDRERVSARWKAWPRNVWFDWVCGRLKGVVGDEWGMGAVISAAIGDELGWHVWVPAGRLSRDSINQGLLWTEIASKNLLRDERGWMGA